MLMYFGSKAGMETQFKIDPKRRRKTMQNRRAPRWPRRRQSRFLILRRSRKLSVPFPPPWSPPVRRGACHANTPSPHLHEFPTAWADWQSSHSVLDSGIRHFGRNSRTSELAEIRVQRHRRRSLLNKTDTCGVRAHALTDWRLEPAP